jgi:hypothetical protein
MTRVAICGSAFDDAAELLGLERVDEGARVVLVDVRDAQAIAAAAALPPDLARIAVGGPEHEILFRALGSRGCAFATSADPAAIGPLIRAAAPALPRRASRSIAVTSAAGGSGRTLLVANLAGRLALRMSVVVVDLTGTGSAAWWLGVSCGPWSDLEGLVDELNSEHLAVVAAENGGVRVLGGPSVMPSAALTEAVLRVAPALGDLVLIDAPPLADERTRALAGVVDRLVVLAADRPSADALDVAEDDRIWLVASRSRAARIAGRPVLRALPDDPRSVSTALRGRVATGGALGRAYDDLAELLAIDAS